MPDEHDRGPSRLTALRRVGRGRVALEVDGAPWRTVPDEVVVRARLALGQRLDRAVLREIRRELRRADALGQAGRALARRDVSEAGLRARLERGGVAAPLAREATEALRRAGALDDERFSRNRARWLAERGWGDEAILATLEAEGASPDLTREAVAALDPEAERAAALVRNLAPRKAARLLSRRGFAPESVETVVPALDVGHDPGLP
ncbi:MAG TPA: RecX family transcriptional regulator [Gaiellaceae bacterium]|nr:RecX family transcriptional regulator [Gaiellaceae bacterium]